MICCLCTQETEDGYAVFSLEGKHLRICQIVEKHFWFTLSEENPLLSNICCSCWTVVKDFHSFYGQVEKSHNLYLAKIEHLKGGSSTPNETDMVCDIAIKLEPELVLDEIHDDEIIESRDYDPLLNNSKIEDSEQDEDSRDAYTEQDHDSERYLSHNDSTDSEAVHESKSKSGESSTLMKRTSRRKRGRRESLKKPSTKHNAEARNKEIDEKIAQVLELGCDLCDLVEPNYRKLMQHMKETHNVKGYTVCCSKKFTRRGHLINHIEKHINPNYCRCEHCGKNLANKQCLEQHIFRKHPPEEDKIFACTECNKKFSKQFILERHQVIHQEKTNICESCNKGFHTLQKLKTHIKAVHDSGGHMCEICAKVILCRVAFKRHTMTHVGVEMPRVQCDICQNWYKDDYALSLHKRNHEQASIMHKCEICGKVSASRRALLCHINYVHTAERKFECNVCQKSFKKAINLREHMTLHTGEVLYKCPHCPRTFNSNSNMYSHRKKAHPEEFEEARRNRIMNGITEENKVLKYTN